MSRIRTDTAIAVTVAVLTLAGVVLLVWLYGESFESRVVWPS